MFWLHFPAILKGWLARLRLRQRHALTREGWKGHTSGRVPLMHHTKTWSSRRPCSARPTTRPTGNSRCGRIIDDWGLRYPGVKHVEHIYFYGAAIADPPQIQQYLRDARQLGRDFAVPAPAPAAASTERVSEASDGSVLAYVDAVPGRLYPLVETLLELSRRGHHVIVKAGIDDIARLRSVGLHAEPLARPIERFEPDDWKARTRFGALMSGLRQFGERARDQATDLAAAIDTEQPDALLIDEGSWGAAAAAERSGLPSAVSLVSPVPLTSRDAPPFGLGLRPATTRSADCATVSRAR